MEEKRKKLDSNEKGRGKKGDSSAGSPTKEKRTQDLNVKHSGAPIPIHLPGSRSVRMKGRNKKGLFSACRIR